MTPRILIVEDDPMLREALVALLRRAGYETIPAATCHGATEALEEEPDLALLDVSLPDGDGFSLCRAWREKGVALPILFLTAYDREEQIVKGLDSGGDDYIAKPFRTQELLSRVRARLRRTADRAVYRSGGLAVDLQAMTAEKDGAPLSLTRTEFQLLAVLVRNAGRAVTRETLLGRIWDDAGVFVDDNTLSVHISRLREKVGPERIATVRGTGYRWMEE